VSERLDKVCRNTGESPILMCAVVAGDPHIDATIDYVSTVAEAGADVIELIVPFSDPAYHGPVIQRACDRALSEGLNWRDVQQIGEAFREDHDTAMIVSSYYNRVLATGRKSVSRRLGTGGIDGLMVADLPWDEAGPMRRDLEAQQLDFIPQIAPTTSAARLREIGSEASQFVVWTGHSGGEVTLSKESFGRSMEAFHSNSDTPVFASMKISSGEEAAAVKEYADGVLVGSALTWLIEGRGKDLRERLWTFVQDLRMSIDGESPESANP
jgi:tryptophan synthase alpha chain